MFAIYNMPTNWTHSLKSRSCVGSCGLGSSVESSSAVLFFYLQFSVFLGIIFFLELTAGVLAFVFKDWIKDQLNFFINNNIRAYRDDIDLQNLIDFTQEYVSMCFLSIRSAKSTPVLT